ncbi:MAG: N-acetylneuraminate synthase [Lachnospiraceae bacterium]|nr:N-acetylneuraminate synthase [Lachnospiraceae bacterium]
MNQKVLIIAEAGVNHNNDLETALNLCDAAKESGADVIKFQTWITEKLITKNVQQAEYQIKNTGVSESQFDMLKRLEFSQENFRKVRAYCDKIGLTFASTADDEESLDFLINLGIPFIKVGSGDIGNVSFLRNIGAKQLPVILSTGMSSLADVDISIQALQEGGATDITLLHCTTNYPCPYDQVNLRAMLTLKDAFHLPVGYSDHTIGDEVAVAAVGLGAKVIEKHFTLDCHMEGPDHIASTEPKAFRKMVEKIRHIEAALGDGVKTPTSSERRISKVVTKRIVASNDISKGKVITAEDICVKRNDIGMRAAEWDRVIGSIARKDYLPDEGIIL